MILEIPLIPNPNRTLKILLNNQECTITMQQKGKYIFLDLDVGDVAVCRGAICLNLVPVVLVSQSVFRGNLVFVDTLSDTAPQYKGLGSQYFLLYYTEDETMTQVIQTKVGYE